MNILNIVKSFFSKPKCFFCGDDGIGHGEHKRGFDKKENKLVMSLGVYCFTCRKIDWDIDYETFVELNSHNVNFISNKSRYEFVMKREQHESLEHTNAQHAQYWHSYNQSIQFDSRDF